jgi:hypothetical protein
VIGTYTGGCHCGGLRFEAELDLSAGTIKCNCSYCVKSRFWLARTEPENFRASGEAKDYRGCSILSHIISSVRIAASTSTIALTRQTAWAAFTST